jgi:hypothetical protein
MFRIFSVKPKRVLYLEEENRRLNEKIQYMNQISEAKLNAAIITINSLTLENHVLQDRLFSIESKPGHPTINTKFLALQIHLLSLRIKNSITPKVLQIIKDHHIEFSIETVWNDYSKHLDLGDFMPDDTFLDTFLYGQLGLVSFRSIMLQPIPSVLLKFIESENLDVERVLEFVVEIFEVRAGIAIGASLLDLILKGISFDTSISIAEKNSFQEELRDCLGAIKKSVVDVCCLSLVLNVKLFISEDEEIEVFDGDIHNAYEGMDDASMMKGPDRNARYIATVSPGLRSNDQIILKEDIIWGHPVLHYPQFLFEE